MPAPPPAKKSKVNLASGGVDASQEKEECTTISMVVGEGDCLSPITRINGYPWRLRLDMNSGRLCVVYLKCEKSMESELWNCEASIHFKKSSIADDAVPHWKKLKFESVDMMSQEHKVGSCSMKRGIILEVKIVLHDNGNKWRSRPICGPLDAIFLIENKEMHVNKESLASQSSYFESLFNEDFKENNMEKITIGDVSFEEFSMLMKMVYGKNDDSVVGGLTTRESVHRVLELADRFDLKIVEEGVTNVLLSSSSPFSFHERLIIAEKHGLITCRDVIIRQSSSAQLKQLSTSPEYGQLSMATKHSLFRKSCGTFTGLTF